MNTKKTAIVALVSLFAFHSAASAGGIFDELSSLEKDTYVHFSAGVLISHASYPVFRKYAGDRRRAMWYSLLLAVAVSAAKEAYDSGTTGFNGGDLAAGALGAGTIFVIAFD